MPNSAQYQDVLLRLLPPGKAWTRDPGSTMAALALGLADEFARLDARALDLIEEADPRTTVELLQDWEQTAGLPDPAIPAPVTLDDRHAALATRLISVAGQTDADYLALVAPFGYPVSIVTHTPFSAGVGFAGGALYDAVSIFWWEMDINVPIGTTTPVILLEHAVRRVNQLHTFVTFNYLFV